MFSRFSRVSIYYLLIIIINYYYNLNKLINTDSTESTDYYYYHVFNVRVGPMSLEALIVACMSYGFQRYPGPD